MKNKFFKISNEDLRKNLEQNCVFFFRTAFIKKYKKQPIGAIEYNEGFCITLDENVHGQDNIDVDDESFLQLVNEGIHNELSIWFPLFDKKQLIDFRKEVVLFFLDSLKANKSNNLKETIIQDEQECCKKAIAELKNHPDRLFRLAGVSFLEDYQKEIPRIFDLAKKYKAKYYALYHAIMISINKALPFNLNNNDQYKSSEIKEFAEKNFQLNDGQGFYREFLKIDLTNKRMIANYFGQGYKKIIIEISNNDSAIKNELKKYPD